MRIQEFKYTKEDVTTNREVMVAVDSANFIEGIDLKQLSVEDRAKLIDLNQKFEDELKYFISLAWRRFSKTKITY